MTQPLNYTPKAIADLMALPCPNAPGTRAMIGYLIDKMKAAQVFVLSDGGQLLDRSKPRPDVPGTIYRPPYPIVALEYESAPNDWDHPLYSTVSCPRRIALAWEWENDLPIGPSPTDLGEGVAIASIAWNTETQSWTPIGAAIHFGYDSERLTTPPVSGFRDAMIAAGRITPKVASSSPHQGGLIPIMPEAIDMLTRQVGPARASDMLNADLMDEYSAYFDLCMALACKNVTTRHRPAPAVLNKQRVKKGKLPLMGFHVLELSGAGAMPGATGAAGDRNGPRSHLRRGHIRRLSGERVTWVNSTVVRGRGFVDKVYAA